MANKSIRVGRILFHANHALSIRGADSGRKERSDGIRSLVDVILFDSGNYAGFSYLDTPATERSRIQFYVSDAVRADYAAARAEHRTSVPDCPICRDEPAL
jgi:hypothetical protein